jgi:GDP-D-mannose 3',5'-epimerase
MMESGLENGPIQLGTDRCTTIRELAELVVRISGKDIEIRYDVSKPEGDKGRRANSSKAEKVLGWKPHVSMEDGLRATYSWIKRRIEANPAIERKDGNNRQKRLGIPIPSHVLQQL